MLNSYKHSKGISVATENYLHKKKLLSKKVIYKTEYYMILYFKSVKHVQKCLHKQ